MKSKSNNSIVIIIVLALVVFGIVYAFLSLTQNAGKSDAAIDTEQADKKLEKICKDVNAINAEPIKGVVNIGETDSKENLPGINKYPPQVENTTPDYVEIFSSPEKAGTGSDGWLVEVAENFNNSNISVNGKPVSVMIRGIASGMGMDYIVSGKHIPDAFSPSNEMWGEMIKAKGITIKKEDSCLAGNVAGMLFEKNKNNEIKNKYGGINLKNVVDAVAANELTMGYTNPFASSTGLNFLVSTLSSFDSSDPLSEKAINGFEQFQKNIPFVAYTTMQMRDSASSGVLDGFILEYQTYVNTPEINEVYDFTPFGVRHDSPVYSFEGLSAQKKDILKEFIKFCKNEKNQKSAERFGFNQYNDYKSELNPVTGAQILQAQKLWKDKKMGDKEIIAVFVADTSGSMEGERMTNLKKSLLNGAEKIGNNNQIGLVTFSDSVSINLPIGKFDLNQRSLFAGAVENMSAGGATAMFDGIAVGTKMLIDKKAEFPDAKLMLFVLTDGETNVGHSLNDLESIIRTYRIPVYTIGYNEEIEVLQTISAINEAAGINADTEDVIYKLESLFNAEM